MAYYVEMNVSFTFLEQMLYVYFIIFCITLYTYRLLHDFDQESGYQRMSLRSLGY